MPLFGKNDDYANSPYSAVQQLNKPVTAINRQQLFGNVMANVYFTGRTDGVFGVSANEASALSANGSMGAHAGWVLRTIGQGGRAGRVFVETLVAGGDITGDASDDLVFQDYRVVITSQPQNNTQLRGNSVNYIVGASTVPPGGTLTYQWQQDMGNTVLTWANVPNTGVFASANGNQSFTLSVSNNFTVTGNNFRVIVGSAGANNVISANASISYT